MDAGGIYQNGGSGTGTVTISGLRMRGYNEYQVQVFNYAPDGDPGLTTFSGTTPVTLSSLPWCRRNQHLWRIFYWYFFGNEYQ